MKFIVNILLAVLLLCSASCNRKVVAASTHTKLDQDSSSVAIDTSKGSFCNEEENTTYYGDTLIGNIWIPNTDTVYTTKDSLESNGIKIVTTLTPVKNGFKLNLNAIAKPKQTNTRITTTTTIQKGIANSNNNKKKLVTDAITKNIEAVNEVPKWTGLTIMFLGILALAAITIYLYIKNEKNGNV